MELNERQKELYKLLDYLEFAPTSLITDYLADYYPRKKEKNKKENSSAFRRLRKDIREINFSNPPRAIISVKRGNKLIGYKLSSKEETLDYALKLRRHALANLQLSYQLEKMVQNEGMTEMFEDSKFSKARMMFEV